MAPLREPPAFCAVKSLTEYLLRLTVSLLTDIWYYLVSTPKDEAVQEYINSDSCYWVLLSTSAKTALEALGQYRERNGVEVYFDDEKNLLDLRRLKNYNEQTVKRKIFVTFISLVILSQLRKMVDKVDKKKRKYWSEHDMLRKVKTYAKIHFDGKYKDVYTTPTLAQRFVFDIFGMLYTFKGKDSDPKGDGA